MSNYLVTGGAGFIGSHLCDRLISLGHSVVCLDNFNSFYSPAIKQDNIRHLLSHPSFTLVEGDIRNLAELDKCLANKQVDAVLHLAAMAGVRPSIEQPGLYADVNITGTLQVLLACQRHGIKHLVFASSSSVYGNREGGAFSESDNVDFPISPYAATKKAGELLCYNWHHLYQLSVSCLRFFTVYGPRQRPDLAIHKFATLMQQNEPIIRYGDGNTGRDYTYIDDIIDGVLKALDYTQKHFVYEVFNLGESRTITLNEMIETIAHTGGFHPQIIEQPLHSGEVRYTCADITKSRLMLDYNPSFSFEKGIALFLEWFRQKPTDNL